MESEFHDLIRHHLRRICEPIAVEKEEAPVFLEEEVPLARSLPCYGDD